MTDIKKGDRVKVTFEAEVRGINARHVSVENDLGDRLGEVRHDLVTIEKIEPPVEAFKPGDVVRFKTDPGLVIALTSDGGYTYLGPTNRGIHAKPGGHEQYATSHLWERVNIE